MNNIPFHPLSEVFPLIHGDEFVSLKDDLAANGQIEPIWLYEGKILDGRNRFRACQEISLEPEFREYAGDSPAAFVISLNMRRRHLTASQRAAAAVEFLPWLEQEAEARRKLLSGTRADPGQVVEKIPPPDDAGKSRDKAAELVGVNPRYVSDAKKIKADTPDEFERIKTGEKTLSQVKRETSVVVESNSAPEKDLPQSRGVGVKCAHEAIAVLKRIPLNDGLRQDALNMVLDWIETNK